MDMKHLRWLLLVVAPSCILQPKPPPSAAPVSANGVKKKPVALEKWAVIGQGMLGASADTKGSKMSWQVADEGPKAGQKALVLDYEVKSGGWCGVWHTLEHTDLSKADGLKFLAKADPAGTVKLSMTDANRVSYIAIVQVAKEWSEIRVPLAALDKNPNYQPPESKQGLPPDWTRTTSLNFDAFAEGQGKIWIGPVFRDDAE